MRGKDDKNQDKKIRGLKRVLLVVAADVAGALLSGDVGTGVSCSTLVNQLINEYNKEIENRKNALANVPPGTPGYEHNVTILNIYDRYGVVGVDTLSLEEIADASVQEYSKLTGVSYTEKEKNEMCKLLKEIELNFDESKSISQNMEFLASLSADPVKKRAINVCAIVVEGLQYVDDEDTAYLADATEIINNSDLSPQEKTAILDGFSVADASAKLWVTEVDAEIAE